MRKELIEEGKGRRERRKEERKRKREEERTDSEKGWKREKKEKE